MAHGPAASARLSSLPNREDSLERMRPIIALSVLREDRRIVVLGVWLGVLALLAQVLVPLAHRAAMQGPGIVLCTPDGVVTVDPDGKPADPAKAAPKSCPICQTLQGLAAFVPPALDFVFLVLRPAEAARYVARAEILRQRVERPGQPRGPPIPLD